MKKKKVCKLVYGESLAAELVACRLEKRVGSDPVFSFENFVFLLLVLTIQGKS